MKINYPSEIIVIGKPKSKGAFFRACERSLNFPNYFGRNWDAFEEVISNPEDWYEEKSLGLVLDPSLLEEEDQKILKDIFNDAQDAWQHVGFRLTLVLGPITVCDNDSWTA